MRGARTLRAERISALSRALGGTLEEWEAATDDELADAVDRAFPGKWGPVRKIVKIIRGPIPNTWPTLTYVVRLSCGHRVESSAPANGVEEIRCWRCNRSSVSS